ncbi:MAG: hypothetical protein K2V38_09865, partial [Gemmataceae bacterium]|nr:hypothetical protein [Gemmataceae bacterium]
MVLVRRDPRDLSRVYLYIPETGGYLDVPYRDLSRPAITLWEHRLALRRLREQHRAVIDESALFRAVTELRAIERAAVATTKTARRNATRRNTSVVIPLAATPVEK